MDTRVQLTVFKLNRAATVHSMFFSAVFTAGSNQDCLLVPIADLNHIPLHCFIR